jgi:opacity protein-like surface antigen
MMKKGLFLIAGMLMSGLTMVPAAHAQQVYAGVGLGAFELDPGSQNKLATGVMLQLGDDFFPYLGGEIRVGTTDKASNHSVLNWFAGVYAKPKIDISEDVTLYGLLGVTAMRASYPSLTTGLYQHSTKADFSYGLGVEYWSTNQVTVNADWVRYATRADAATKNTAFKGLDVNSYTLGVQYHF